MSAGDSGGGRAFVLLEHTVAGDRHWDLLIDDTGGPRLATWRVLRDPRAGDGPVPVTPLPAHRREYLTYEGPISGDRGVVRRVEQGVVHLASDFDAETGGGLTIRGKAWRGQYRISAAWLTRLGQAGYD